MYSMLNTVQPFGGYISKRVVITIAAVLVVILGSAGFLFRTQIIGWFQPGGANKSVDVLDANGTVLSEAAKAALVTSDTASELANKGNTAESYKVLDVAIAASTDDDAKVTLLTARGVITQNDPAQGVDKALTYALEAEATAPSQNTADYVASLYEKKGDTANAITYYELAGSRDVSGEKGPRYKLYYEAKVKALKGE